MKDLGIQLAYDKNNGNSFFVPEQLKDYKIAHIARYLYAKRRYNDEDKELKERYFPNFDLKNLCCETCDQPLEFSKNLDRVYLRHRKNLQTCSQKDYKKEDSDIIHNIYRIKERPEHIFLKNRIGNLLDNTPNVSDVIVDKHFLFNEFGKRKPDIFCHYKNVILVFEIQISIISYRYILDRVDFYQQKYKDKNVYLIWILNKENLNIVQKDIANEGINEQSSMAKDIKYLNYYQNFFQLPNLDEKELNLLCHYKEPFIKESLPAIHSIFKSQLISLSDLKFDENRKVVYFRNYKKLSLELTPKLEILKILKQEKEQAENDKRIKAEEERRKVQILYEERVEACKMMQNEIHRKSLIAKSISDLSIKYWGKLEDRKDLKEKLKTIRLKEMVKSINKILKQYNYPYYSQLDIPIELFNKCKEQFSELNLYSYYRGLNELETNQEYITAVKKIEFINKLKTREFNTTTLSEVNKKEFPILFQDIAYKNNIYYFEKKDLNDLFGLNIKPKSYYDNGDNPNHIYLYDFSSKKEEFTDKINGYKRAITLAKKSIEEMKDKILPILQKEYLGLCLELDKRILYLQCRHNYYIGLHEDYFDKITNTSNFYMCAYFNEDYSICLKNYHSDYNYHECSLFHGKFYKCKKSNVDFCPDYRLQKEKEMLEDIIRL
jgi:hypothetical protein